jgi:hypothetical protein
VWNDRRESPTGWGRGVSAGGDAHGAAGGARSGDGGGSGCREERADGGPDGLPFGLLRADADHADRQARAARAAGPGWTVLDGAVRALSALGAGAGGGAGGDVRAGVSTRKVKAITEELCGHSFSASSISAINQRLDASLAQFADRTLGEAFPYLILYARYERVREAGVISSQAVLTAIGIDWDGRRQVLAVEMANRESRSSWRDFLLTLKARGLNGVEFVVADDHAGLREALPEAATSVAMCTSGATRSTTCRARACPRESGGR